VDAFEWDQRYRSADRLWSATPNLFVADRLKAMTPGLGLDLAAGEGRNAVWLASLGWKMTAVDFSEVAVERGSAHSDEIDFVVADVLEWEPTDSYDLILIAYLQMVASDFEMVLLRAREWLSPDGELFLIGHDASNISDGWGGPQYPEVLWEVPAIVGMLDGMFIVESQVVRRPVETEDGPRFARDALVRARPRPPQG
jgi:SAM-dependent methyltransferase